MKKQHQDFLRKQNKLRTGPPKRIKRVEKQPAAKPTRPQPDVKPAAQPAGKTKEGDA